MATVKAGPLPARPRDRDAGGRVVGLRVHRVRPVRLRRRREAHVNGAHSSISSVTGSPPRLSGTTDTICMCRGDVVLSPEFSGRRETYGDLSSKHMMYHAVGHCRHLMSGATVERCHSPTRASREAPRTAPPSRPPATKASPPSSTTPPAAPRAPACGAARSRPTPPTASAPNTRHRQRTRRGRHPSRPGQRAPDGPPPDRSLPSCLVSPQWGLTIHHGYTRRFTSGSPPATRNFRPFTTIIPPR
jgi:hypothetical protein